MKKISPKAHQWVISTTAIIFIAVGTFILVAFAQGYSFDFKNWKLNANGLILIDSSPNGANITINNQFTNKKTPFRYTNATAGNIYVALQKNDYRDWNAIQSVLPSQVTFLDYAFLLPNILSQQNISQTNSPNSKYSNIFQSTDNSKYVAVSQDSLSIYNISDPLQPKLIYQPQIIDPNKQVRSLEVMQISNDGNKIMVSQNLNNGSREVVIVNSNGVSSENISQEFGFDFKNLFFNQKDANELFWLDKSDIKKIRLSNKSISSNLVSSVESIDVEKDRLLVVKKDSSQTKRNIYSYDLSGQDERLIYQVEPDQAGYELAFINSRYSEYLFIKYKSTNVALLIKSPYGHQEVKNLGSDIGMYTISPNQRFLVLSQNNLLVSYDLEFGLDYKLSTSLKDLLSWSWFDNYHIVLQKNNQLYFVDFDGQNNQLLTPIADINNYVIDNNDKAILPLNKSGELFKLWLVKK